MDNPSQFGYVRAAAISPELRVADVAFNVRATIEALERASALGCQLALLPELGLTGYTCGDLFYQSLLLQAARDALPVLADAAKKFAIAVVIGLPLLQDGKIYNCAALLCDGEIIGLVPKTYLPTTRDYYEARWFTPGKYAPFQQVEIAERTVPFGADLLFRARNMVGCVIGIEICEDMWAIHSPNSDKALAGATLLLNPSASADTFGKSDARLQLVAHHSARCLAAYLYAGASANESTTDLVFAGQSVIAENGTVLAQTERFRFDTQMAVADIDIEELVNERTRNTSFSAQTSFDAYRTIEFQLPFRRDVPLERLPTVGNVMEPLYRGYTRTPFVPEDAAERAKCCREMLTLQATALAQRLKHDETKSVIVRVSREWDSTWALLVAVKAFDTLGLERKGILALSIPGSDAPRAGATMERLAALLGVSFRSIPIAVALRQHLDFGQAEHVADGMYDKAQARERAQVSMDVAEQMGALVVGSTDMSEWALGSSASNSSLPLAYEVNVGVPKTLVRCLVEWAASDEYAGDASAILHDIAATPDTAELGTFEVNGQAHPARGPVEVNDFLLYYMVRHQFAPRKIYFLARQAFGDTYDAPMLLSWLTNFFKDFFAQQRYRSAMAEGPHVASIALSPRGDWRMPGDASAALWLEQIQQLQQES